MTEPAEELRAAAEKLRALLVDLCDCRGPWYVVNREQRPYPQRIDNIGVPYVVASTTTDPSHPPTIADYIVTMHPGVGKALAAWLEAEAAGNHAVTGIGDVTAELMNVEFHRDGHRAVIEHSTLPQALAVARAINTPGAPR